MAEPATAKLVETCRRCLEPVPPKAARCPHCGDPIEKTVNIGLVLGVFGVLLLLAMGFVGLHLMGAGGSDAGNAPPSGSSASSPETKPALGQ